MNPSRWLVLSVLVLCGNGSSAADSSCEDYDEDKFDVLEGEAFYVIPMEMDCPDSRDANVTWYKEASHHETISSDEGDRIHHHGRALFLLNLRPEDSGLYVARERKPSGQCFNHPVEIKVFNASYRGELKYEPIDDADQNKAVPCPKPIAYLCHSLKGSFTWYKDFSLLQGQHEATLEIINTSQADNGLYTCVCSWKHNGRIYNSSGSREVIHTALPPVYRSIVLSPADNEMFADEGTEIKLKCSFFCGINLERSCSVTWSINRQSVTDMEGYSQTTTSVTEPSRRTVVTAVLTIRKVSAPDFHAQFKCVGEGLTEAGSAVWTLKRRESIVPSVVTAVCVLLSGLLVALLVKYFAVDLALFFRQRFPFHRHSTDTRLYDAYVVYQTQGLDPLTENSLCQFVTQILPSVLERKCGYRLFIHGRDDIPGEDRLQMVEDCMKQSRRLIVILAPGSQSGSEFEDQQTAFSQTSLIGGFDWQVGLHHVLVQSEMSVILIQLGPTGPRGYSHLPPGLQHLLRQSTPLRWNEGLRGATKWRSRFWKKVQYLMPAVPARTRTQPAFEL